MEQIIHSLDGQKCTCTLHDIGYNCRRALSPDGLHREMSELVRVARLSGFDAAAIGDAFTSAIQPSAGEAQK